jgi:hypothetical protein
MTRHPALVAQADIARAARVAASLGPGWRVEIEGPVIRLIQSAPSDRPSPERDPEPQFARGLAVAP